MQAENSIFFFHDADMQLFCRARGGSFGKLTPSAIDEEMQHGKSRTRMHLHCPTQEGLEHFVCQYGSAYEVLYLDNCTSLTDLSPLVDLPKLTAICIERCRMIKDLWPISENKRLRILSIRESKRLTDCPSLIGTSESLEEIRFWGAGSEHKYRMQSLAPFAGMPSLKRLDLNAISLADHSMDVLDTLPALEEFHFDAGMLTTDEIAQICVRFPQLYGQSLGAYSVQDVGVGGNVRICGSRKPSLMLPEDAEKLNQHIEQFNRLKEQYTSALEKKN